MVEGAWACILEYKKLSRFKESLLIVFDLTSTKKKGGEGRGMRLFGEAGKRSVSVRTSTFYTVSDGFEGGGGSTKCQSGLERGL